jgi:hypothetical protein
MAADATAKKIDSPGIRFYQLGFLQSDDAVMADQVSWAADRPGDDAEMLYYEADTAAYYGQLNKARELSLLAVASAERAGRQERATACKSGAALREVLFGNNAETRRFAAKAPSPSSGKDTLFLAGLALAMAGDRDKAVAFADSLKSRFPEDTIVQFNYLPTINAQVALKDGNPTRAIEFVRAATPYELGLAASSNYSTYLYPVFVRGQAFLAEHQGAAAVEFQKMLNWPGVVFNEPIGALAHLQLGRAYALNGDAAKARAAYEDFLALWKDADPDIPILKQAKAEYAKLQ